MQKSTLSLLLAGLLCSSLQAQVCDPSHAPNGLTSTHTPGSGALLEWNAVPGSVGVQLRVNLPSGGSIIRRIVGTDKDNFLIPDALLSVGAYTWRVQAACSTIPPYDVTPISALNSFTVATVGGGGSCPATVTDVDGNVYSIVQIGSQCWIRENLKVEHYRNGDSIPAGGFWSLITYGAFRMYGGISANKTTYGLLYNYYATIDTRGLCPTGWHVPTDAEWTMLTDFLGGEFVAGGKMKTAGTLSAGTGLWESPNTSATNSSGFSGLPGGSLNFLGFPANIGEMGFWWSSSEYTTYYAYSRKLYHNFSACERDIQSMSNGYSVRCLRDE